MSAYLREGTLDFASYAQFVMDAPQIVPATPDEDEVSHALSMVFPDIRAKHILEIRVADSMPADAIMAYGVIIRTMMAQPKEALEMVGAVLPPAGQDTSEQHMSERGMSERDTLDRGTSERDMSEQAVSAQEEVKSAICAFAYAHCNAEEKALLDQLYGDFVKVTSLVRDLK